MNVLKHPLHTPQALLRAPMAMSQWQVAAGRNPEGIGMMTPQMRTPLALRANSAMAGMDDIAAGVVFSLLLDGGGNRAYCP